MFFGITELRNQSCVIPEPVALIFSVKSWSEILITFSRKAADQNPVTTMKRSPLQVFSTKSCKIFLNTFW